MSRANEGHLRWGLFDAFRELPEKLRKRLETSWADAFYRQAFCRIDETPFAVLYADEPSRANGSINVLMGAEILKAGYGWSDEELYDAIQATCWCAMLWACAA